jgi:hypothetical protein
MRHPGYVGWFIWSVATQILLLNPVCVCVFAVVVSPACSCSMASEQCPQPAHSQRSTHHATSWLRHTARHVQMPSICASHASTCTVFRHSLFLTRLMGVQTTLRTQGACFAAADADIFPASRYRSFRPQQRLSVLPAVLEILPQTYRL